MDKPNVLAIGIFPYGDIYIPYIKYDHILNSFLTLINLFQNSLAHAAYNCIKLYEKAVPKAIILPNIFQKHEPSLMASLPRVSCSSVVEHSKY